MSSEQYRTGTSSVTAGSQIVSGYGTSWNTQVAAGDIYKPDVDGQPTQVIGSVDSATQLTLSANWSGNSYTDQAYLIQRSWTSNLKLARPFQGDADIADILREQVIDKLDNNFSVHDVTTAVTGVSGANSFTTRISAGTAQLNTGLSSVTSFMWSADASGVAIGSRQAQEMRGLAIAVQYGYAGGAGVTLQIYLSALNTPASACTPGGPLVVNHSGCSIAWIAIGKE